MIVISDSLKKRLTPTPVRKKARLRPHKEPILLKGESNTIENIELYSWGNQAIPSVFDYETIVLDMNIAASDKQLEAQFKISNDVHRALMRGNTVICLTHYFKQFPIYSAELKREIVCETFGWLNGWADDITFHPSKGKNFILLKTPQTNIFKRYFDSVEEYNAIIEGVKANRKGEDQTEFYIVCGKYHRHGGHGVYRTLDIISLVKTTSDVIACSINFGGGNLIFLPQSTREPKDIISELYEIGKHYYGEDIVYNAPDWIDDYKTMQEIELEKEYEFFKLETREKAIEFKRELRRYSDIDILLWGTGKPLEKAVKKCFEEFGLEINKTEPGFTIDLVGKDKKDRKLAVEVTGTNGKIKKESNKITQLFQYSQFNKKESEKLVFVANTYCTKKVEERKEGDFTKDAINLLNSLGVCSLTSLDMYFLWKKYSEEKIKGNEIIDKIFSTIGPLSVERG
jgi:hypothetical protein